MAKIIGQYQGKNIYEGTDAEVSKQMFGNTQQQNSSVSTPNYSINSENLKPIIPSPIAKTTEDTDYSGLLNSSIAQTENNYSSYQKEVDRLNEKAKNESGNISTLQYLLGNKDEDINVEYSKVGTDGKSIFDLDKDLGSLNAEASVLKREASAIPLQIQQEFANTGATERGVAPIETGRLRENAIKALSIAQQSDILTGRLNSAKNIADKLIDAKYSKLDAQIKARQTNLASLEKYELSPAERKLAESTSRKLELEKAELENKKNNERTIQDLIIKASGQNAPSSVLASAQKAKTPQEAAIALGQWAGDYWQNQKLDSELKKLQKETIATGGYSTGNLAVGSLTKESGVTLDQYMTAISGNESRGLKDRFGGNDPYQVVSPPSKNGDKAYGKYQVMGKNIPVWTKEVFGKAMSIEEFLNSPEKQDQVIRYRAEKDYAKYGNWDDVASVWFSGRPAKGNVSSDVLGTTVPEYISRFRNNLGNNVDTNSTQTLSSLNLDKVQMAQYNDIVNEVNTQIKNDIETVKFANSINSTGEQAKNGNRQAQVAIIFNFMKALDPTSTVRESEFSLAQNAQSAPENFRQAITKFNSGERLSNEVINEMIAVAQDRAKSSRLNIENSLSDAEFRASQFKIPKGSISSLYKNRVGENNNNSGSQNSATDDIFNTQSNIINSTPKYTFFGR